MAREIERKFLVTDQSCKAESEGLYYKQGYFKCQEVTTMPASLKIRIRIGNPINLLLTFQCLIMCSSLYA